MLTIHTLQNPGPGQSGIITSAELSRAFSAALAARDVDLDQVNVAPDDTVTVWLADGRIAAGDDDGWLTAVVHTVDDERWIYEGESLTGLADAIAAEVG